MFSTKIILLSLALPPGTWLAWTSLEQSHLVIRVAIAVLVSFGLFMAILRATEHRSVAVQLTKEGVSPFRELAHVTQPVMSTRHATDLSLNARVPVAV